MTLSEKAAAAQLSEREVVARGLSWVTPELIDGVGLARLRAWTAAGCPAPDLAALRFAGDDEIGVLALEALDRQIPHPVARHAIATAIFVGVGRRAAGLYQGGLPVDVRDLIVVDGRGRTDDEILAIVAHEIAHSWRADERRGTWSGFKAQREAEATYAFVATAWGFTARAVEPIRREEIVVSTLARQWGFCHAPADPGYAARMAPRQIQEAAERYRAAEQEE